MVRLYAPVRSYHIIRASLCVSYNRLAVNIILRCQVSGVSRFQVPGVNKIAGRLGSWDA